MALLVETIVREDAIALYGFLETPERDWFRILTTVQGVGARVALSILSTLPPDEIVRAEEVRAFVESFATRVTPGAHAE